MRLHDLGRPGEGQLSRLRLDHVQEGGPGGEKALLHQRGMLQLHPGGEAGRLAKKTEESGEEAPAQEAAEEGKTAEKKAPAAKKTTAKAAAKKPAAKAAASKASREKAHG